MIINKNASNSGVSLIFPIKLLDFCENWAYTSSSLCLHKSYFLCDESYGKFIKIVNSSYSDLQVFRTSKITIQQEEDAWDFLFKLFNGIFNITIKKFSRLSNLRLAGRKY
jgi:hypothetical protein